MPPRLADPHDGVYRSVASRCVCFRVCALTGIMNPLPQTIAPMPAISGAFMFLPREDFWNMGGFDEKYFIHVEDLDLCLRFRRAGGGIYFAPDIRVTHVGATSNATKAFIEKHKARGFVRYFHKNFGAEYPLPLLWLLDAAIWVRMGLRLGWCTAKIGALIRGIIIPQVNFKPFYRIYLDITATPNSYKTPPAQCGLRRELWLAKFAYRNRACRAKPLNCATRTSKRAGC